jgi:DNA/RNA-binding domain of Phe-tRNA-synthetase-like protein
MSEVSNPERHPELALKKKDAESQLRASFKAPADLKALPVISAYRDYYKRFKKSYHILAQLESIIFKAKPIPHVAALVEAMFMAELTNMLLTAGHDLDAVDLPARLDVAQGGEKYVRINGQEQELKAGDMIIADAEGVISSVIYGPDQRTRIMPATRKVLFTSYAVPGIGEEAVRRHLEGIESNVRIVAPDSKVELMKVYGTD